MLLLTKAFLFASMEKLNKTTNPPSLKLRRIKKTGARELAPGKV